ncbi:tRNA 5-methylaminomethyl-2-thiouridine synthase TusB [Halorhodospira halochloris]|uniref:tRNA 5-methylaminomethyl-2-thiouridine synthase TusB n=1 Tax=Halorhodospira halochloris TaxID=1052 RepID=A0A0X8XAE4_HALHR|nr:sulfurtransferase complex subunit TusB [Halorhodospira halochloris]MBK1652209.1 sulfurtransferase complex subunit TusB [Halorhodospira halochloris]BAU58370.1 tRNA 5-methylaminomethyl-2-thiouridine synthase TusB [Halorhodospira halochloris]
MLHTVNKSPLQTRDLDSCLAHLGDGRLLLIEDGVYAALAAAPSASQLADAAAAGRVYALGPDMEARGLAADHLAANIQVVDYQGVVQLVIDHGPHQAWV